MDAATIAQRVRTGRAKAVDVAGEAIDAASWIIPADTLDYGMAIEGMMWKRDQEACGCQDGR